MENYTELTKDQKLAAFEAKFYQGREWKPKSGDYYTSTRGDLELYKIVDEDEDHFFTVYCIGGVDENTHREPWKKSEFLSEDTFGRCRMWVPDDILELC